MKLVRFGEPGCECPGLIDGGGNLRDLTGHVVQDCVFDNDVIARLASLSLDSLTIVDRPYRFGPPVASCSKFIAIGLNYSDHAAESGMPVPAEPIVFMKAPSCIVGCDDTLKLPPASIKSDWEVELGIVIGSITRFVDEDRALDHVAGYLIVNDVSERDYQLERGGTWDKGKGCDTFGPIGPWLVTRDEIDDPQSLDLWLDVNGAAMQRGSTRTMVFSCAQIVSYVSRFMTLLPGDIITTGTPPGVGMGMKPPRFLKHGDVITLGISGLGTQRQEVAAS